MGKLIKIILITALVLLVFLAAFADRFNLPNWLAGLSLAIYLRLSALIGLVVALFLSWGYKRKVEASQKYRRAQEVISQAETTAERKQRTLEQMHAKLTAEFVEKEQTLKDEMAKVKTEYHHRLKTLKEQNLALKETVSKLMQVVKNKGSVKGKASDPSE